jgi:hypothetical protein
LGRCPLFGLVELRFALRVQELSQLVFQYDVFAVITLPNPVLQTAR